MAITITKVSFADRRNETDKPADREYRETGAQKARQASKGTTIIVAVSETSKGIHQLSRRPAKQRTPLIYLNVSSKTWQFFKTSHHALQSHFNVPVLIAVKNFQKSRTRSCHWLLILYFRKIFRKIRTDIIRKVIRIFFEELRSRNITCKIFAGNSNITKDNF